MSEQEQVIRDYIHQRNHAGSYQASSSLQNVLNNENIQIHGNCPQAFYDQNALTNNDIEDFKNKVKIWMRLDDEIKEFTKQIRMLNVEIKQRKKYINTLTPYILSYMNDNGFEELNSKDGGRLQYRTSLIKPPLTQKDLREKLYDQFPNNSEDLDKIFKQREKIAKVSLRRLT